VNGQYTADYLKEAISIIQQLDQTVIERMAQELAAVRERGGRLFILGVGGGAGHASHAVNDFRKIARIESYSPSDNVSELTARTNDEGWDTVYSAWLEGSRLRQDDLLLIFSVGGGDAERNISTNLVRALDLARSLGTPIIGVVGRDGGHTARVATACVIIPVVNPANITPHTESFQALVWHLLVAHPRVQQMPNKWERSVPASQK
jgi:D-sedoheptulose 7-phosphate isomerase